MKPLHSILAVLAFAGNIIAAPVPASNYLPAHQTLTVWRTYTHTKVVGVTKTEWVYPPTGYEGTPSTTGYDSDYPTAYPSSTDISGEEGTTTTPCTTTIASTTDTDPNVVYLTTSTTVTSTDLTVETYTSETPTSAPPSYPPTTKIPQVHTPPPVYTSSTPVYTSSTPVYTSSTPVYTPPAPVYTPPPSSTPISSPKPQPTPQPEEESYPGTTGSTISPSSWQGDATFYAPGLGSCGYTNSESDLIVAPWHALMEQYDVAGNPNKNPLCGKFITCTRGYKSVKVKVVDRCPGCVSLFLSISVFIC